MKYGNVIDRVKKPFNPLKGETYEYQDDKFKMIIEQVSHHPPIHCYHAESENFIFSGFIDVKLVFSLKGFALKPIGQKKLYIKKYDEFYDFDYPDSSIHNFIIGKPYIWHNGKMSAKNTKNGITAEIKFHEKGWTSKNDYKVSGFVRDQNGNQIMKISGFWNSHLNVVDLRDQKEY